MVYQSLKVEAALIKVCGIFSYKGKDVPRLIQAGYNSLPLVDPHYFPDTIEDEVKKTDSFYHDTYYKEFLEIMLAAKGSKLGYSVKPFIHYTPERLTILVKRKNQVSEAEVEVASREIFLFENGIGIFSITLKPLTTDISSISDITAFARSFDCDVAHQSVNYKLHAWISKYVLNEIPLRGSDADAFSGSKFKVFSVISVEEKTAPAEYNRYNLLYELATGSKPATIAEGGYYSPSENYVEQLMSNRISVFRNWDALCLLDSFTVIGGEVYAYPDKNWYSHNTWNRVYFSLYIFNIYIRYSIFMFNHQFLDNEIGVRNRYQTFLNRYNFKYISYNFLPNILFEGMKKGLNLEDEITQFETRISNLANSIQEEQEKRQAILLGIISLLSSISAIDPVVELLTNFRRWLNWSAEVYYPLLSVFMLLLAIPVLIFLFPNMYEKLKRKWM